MMQQEIELAVAEITKTPINPDAFYSRREAAKVLGLAEITLLRNEQKENSRRQEPEGECSTVGASLSVGSKTAMRRKRLFAVVSQGHELMAYRE